MVKAGKVKFIGFQNRGNLCIMLLWFQRWKIKESTEEYKIGRDHLGVCHTIWRDNEAMTISTVDMN